MSLDAYCDPRTDAIGVRDMGSWRAVLDLAQGITRSPLSDLDYCPYTVADSLTSLVGQGFSEMSRFEYKTCGNRGVAGSTTWIFLEHIRLL